MIKSSTNQKLMRRRDIFRISSIHIGVGLSIVTISGFVNAEMKFLGWKSSTITLFFGFAILFELSRLIIGYLQDRRPKIKEYLIIGSILSFLGLLIIPLTISSIDNPIVIVGLALYYGGTAILTTLVDSYLTLVSYPKERNRISGILQSARLIGFAGGGILGSITYSRLEFEIFIGMINIILLLTVIVTLVSLDLKTWQIRMNEISYTSSQYENSNSNTEYKINKSPVSSIYDKNVLLMSSFLIIFSIGLFMQDLILEPFAIARLGFGKSDVGKLVAIWGIATLIFVPVGSILEGKIGKLRTIVIGQMIATIGMIIISISSEFSNDILFYIGLIIFSIGGGISSSPAISLMLDLCYINLNHTTFLLGFFGIIITLGRSIAAISSGVLLSISNDNYTLIFIVEAVFLILSLIPIIPISKLIDDWIREVDSENNFHISIPSLD
ncbi:MAG: BCD family MFS transporter [Candidatus Heimdallarchaeota archaeon]|nr:BCD family MFS transporter [Candidatus Heimdallarchaeota archaeon]